MKHFVSILMMCCATGGTFGQSKEDVALIEKVRKTYAEAEELKVDISYEWFSPEFGERAAQVEQGSYQKKGDYIDLHALSFRQVVNPQHSIIIDETGGSIIVSESSSSVDLFKQLDVSQVLKVCESFSRTDSAHLAILNMTVKDPGTDPVSVQVIIDTQTHYYKSISMRSEDSSGSTGVNVHYRNHQKQSNLDTASIASSQFVAFDQDKVSGVGMYKSFQVLNHTYPSK